MEQRPTSLPRPQLDEYINPANTDFPTSEPPLMPPYSPGELFQMGCMVSPPPHLWALRRMLILVRKIN